MKPITKDTKISDLIPEGYEFGGANSAEAYSEEEGGALFVTIYRKKKQKSFNDYVNEYFDSKQFYEKSRKDVYIILVNKGVSCPFEVKIGILKFICDDIGINWSNYIIYRNHIRMGMEGLNGSAFSELENILPKEFIEILL